MFSRATLERRDFAKPIIFVHPALKPLSVMWCLDISNQASKIYVKLEGHRFVLPTMMCLRPSISNYFMIAPGIITPWFACCCSPLTISQVLVQLQSESWQPEQNQGSRKWCLLQKTAIKLVWRIPIFCVTRTDTLRRAIGFRKHFRFTKHASKGHKSTFAPNTQSSKNCSTVESRQS